MEFLSDEGPHRAAALAFYSIFSLVPLLLLVVSAAGLVFQEGTTRLEMLEYVENAVGPSGRNALERGLSNLHDRFANGQDKIMIALSAVGVLLGASAVFRNLLLSLNQVWDVPTHHHRRLWKFARRRLFAFALTLAAGALLLAASVLNVALQMLRDSLQDFPVSGQFWTLTEGLVSLLVSASLVAVVFRIVPDAKLRWRHVALGAWVTAILLELGRWLTGLYLRHSRLTSIYGAAGSIFVLLAWSYVSWILFFWGAEFTQVLNRIRGRQVEPDQQ